MRVAPTAAQTRTGKLARIGYDRFNPDDRLGFALMLEGLGPEVAAGVRYGRTGEPISIEVGPELALGRTSAPALREMTISKSSSATPRATISSFSAEARNVYTPSRRPMIRTAAFSSGCKLCNCRKL